MNFDPQKAFIWLAIPVLIKFILGGLTIHGVAIPIMTGTDFGIAIGALGTIHAGSKWVEYNNGNRDQK